jgi:hypothetical protein
MERLRGLAPLPGCQADKFGRSERNNRPLASPNSRDASFDHLVGSGEERGRDRQAEHIRRRYVDHKIERSWLLER